MIFLEILVLEIITIAFPILFFQTVHKKVAKTSKDNYRPVRMFQIFLKYMEN